MSAPGASREGRLISTMIDVMIAGMCDPARFRRGRDYARQGAVVDLAVAARVVTARVQGSRAQPYVVTIHTVDPTDTQINPTKLSSLVPTRDEVDFDCDCPDWDSPCKHAVATMVHLSERIAYEPTLLETWRGANLSNPTPRAKVGSRVGAQPVDTEPAAMHLDPDARAALNAFLGTTTSFKQPTFGAAPAPPAAWDEPWSFMLADALTALSRKPR